jgi:16S rRNA (cytosine967-C5)-methyltransferase
MTESNRSKAPSRDRHGSRQQSPQQSKPRKPPPGLTSRDCAVSALYSVFVEKRAFDDAFTQAADRRNLEPRDRAFARLLAATVLRQRGALDAVIKSFLQRPLPENRGRLEPILLSTAAQMLVLKTPPHAAISLAVDQCRADQAAERFASLANAVLRRVSVEGPAKFANINAAEANVPAWMLDRWRAHYGKEKANAIALASLTEPHLDLTVAADQIEWAEKLGAQPLLSHSLRLQDAGRVDDLLGYVDGAWWVQDFAASLPARLLGDIRGKRVADVCAAPGGKTAQLIAAGSNVTAIDKSPGRLKRLAENLQRLRMTAETHVADATELSFDDPYDAILIDAPCTATGTIRRHPDILHLKRLEDVLALANMQAKILQAAAKCVRPGGTLVYCTCSLEPEEGEQQVEAFLQSHDNFARQPITFDDITPNAQWRTAAASWPTPAGDLRTLPHFLSDTDPSKPVGISGGMDGFFAARLIRKA